MWRFESRSAWEIGLQISVIPFLPAIDTLVAMPPKSSAKPPSSSTKSRVKPAAGKPKQPVPTAERLKRLFASLCAQIDGGHFANAIKTCDKSAFRFISL